MSSTPESGWPGLGGVSPGRRLLTAGPRSQRYLGAGLVPPPGALLHVAYEQGAAPVGHRAQRPARRVAPPVLAAGQPQPATAAELTRDLAGWSLPLATPPGEASTQWLW